MNIAQQLGLLRSIGIYYGIPLRKRRLSRFYAQFIRPGDLCFDIGAHVGNRLRAWSALGARIVAVEPQPHCMRLLRRWYGKQPHITLIEQALGAAAGTATLYLSRRTPTVTTLSTDWIDAVRRDVSFRRVEWDAEITVAVDTLDALIARFGAPAFCKIDVEGYELDVLKGLSQPIRALSFEYIPATLDAAERCIERLDALGDYRFNWSPGEIHRLQNDAWLDAERMAERLARIATAGSGDIYARLAPRQPQEKSDAYTAQRV